MKLQTQQLNPLLEENFTKNLLTKILLFNQTSEILFTERSLAKQEELPCCLAQDNYPPYCTDILHKNVNLI